MISNMVLLYLAVILGGLGLGILMICLGRYVLRPGWRVIASYYLPGAVPPPKGEAEIATVRNLLAQREHELEQARQELGLAQRERDEAQKQVKRWQDAQVETAEASAELGRAEAQQEIEQWKELAEKAERGRDIMREMFDQADAKLRACRDLTGKFDMSPFTAVRAVIAERDREVARAEKAERERDEARESQRRLIDDSHLLATLPGVSHGPQIFRQAVAAVQMAHAERDAAIARAEAAETRLQERDQKYLDAAANDAELRVQRDEARAEAEKLAELLRLAVDELEQRHLSDPEARCQMCGGEPGDGGMQHKDGCDVPKMKAALAAWRKGDVK